MTDTQSTPGTPMTAEAARGELASLTSGRNPTLAAAYLNKEAGATDYVNALHQRAASDPQQNGEAAAAPGQQQAPNAGEQGPITLDDGRGALPLTFAPDMPVPQIAEASRVAAETIKGIGLPPDIGRAGIQIIETALARRGATPTPMSDVELQKFEHLLQTRWGAAYDDNCAAVEQAIGRAGRGAAWLQQSIRHVDPATAAELFTMLARRYA